MRFRDLFRKRRRFETYEGLRERLRRFRDLLERNNQVLELIADAGEKLGGEYIFDIQYLRTLAEGIKETMRGIVFNLNALTDNRYPELHDKMRAIESELDAIIESRVVVPPTDLVVPLDRVGTYDASALGEKVARLGEIRRRLGVHVPDGFVISAFACQRVLEQAGIDRLIETIFERPEATDEATLAENARTLADLVRAAALPRQLVRAIRKATSRLERSGTCLSLALRSSALGEDGKVTFAGQYRTLLGVRPTDILSAYKEVLASLFSLHVMQYRQSHGLHPAKALMAVGCMGMVEARAAGVLYTLDPSEPRENRMVIAAAPGLGITVVGGTGGADRFLVSRDPPHGVVASSSAVKEEMYVADSGSPVRKVPVPDGERTLPSISDSELRELAEVALRIERYMRCAQDIEWAVDRGGGLFILQTRPLHLGPSKPAEETDLSEVVSSYQVLLKKRGTVACRGIGAGQVHIVSDEDHLDNLPRGVVLVARRSSPRLAAAMGGASAVVTDIGTPTGHLAAIAREFRVPTIVDTEIATQVLRESQEVTVDAEENVVYLGRSDALLHHQLLRSSVFEESFEFRLLRNMMDRIAPLHLIDPQSPEFSAANCRTCHDIVRFAHEKAVQGLTGGIRARWSSRSPYIRPLELNIPLDLILVDLGDGLDAEEQAARVRLQEVKSAPLRPLLEELTAEGVWATAPAGMDLNGFMASMTRSGPLAPEPVHNLAIISSQYLNLNLHLGYHFNMLDCYLTEKRNDNYIYFRFVGGVTELSRRSRRATFLKKVLEKHDFVLEGKGDLVIGRIKKIPFEAMVDRLRMLGRLIGFSRQLDILLREDSLVDRCVTDFMAGKRVPFES